MTLATNLLLNGEVKIKIWLQIYSKRFFLEIESGKYRENTIDFEDILSCF